MFVGRAAELGALERAYGEHGSALVPIYGRRRVGKSELILRFLQDKAGIYYLGKTAPALLQMQELLRESARILDEPLLASLAVTGWKDVLLAITQRWRGPNKLVLVLDEFQWVAGSSPELPSVLQECWDRHWKKAGNVMLILCGSFVGFMEREVLGKRSPLFGRRTAQMLVQPFSYREAAEFHPSWSSLDRARAYFICGGIPLYLRFFDPARSVEKNIERNLLDEFAPLFREPDFLLREELREVDNYYAVLRAIASGSTVNRDIATQTGIPERSLHYYIQQLVDIGYVAKRYPLTGARPTKHHVRYVLEDPILRFWFYFVFENLSYIQQMGPRRALRERIRPKLDSYYGACFERLCRQALPHLYEREGIDAAFTVGEYWAKDCQIDVVGLRDDGWTDLGECKWGKVRSLPKLRDELEAKVARYPNRRNATIGRRFFLQTMPSSTPPEVPNAHWHDVDDLYR